MSFVVVVTGPPGSGKTAALTALSDALSVDRVPHAAVDVDEVAWAYPYPSLVQRCDHLRGWWRSHRGSQDVLLVAEVVEGPGHLSGVLAAVGAHDNLLVRLEAEPDQLRRRIIAREPPGWSGLERLLAEAQELHVTLPKLDGVHLVLDTEELAPSEIAARIRAARPDRLVAGGPQPTSRSRPVSTS